MRTCMMDGTRYLSLIKHPTRTQERNKNGGGVLAQRKTHSECWDGENVRQETLPVSEMFNNQG